MMCRRRLTSLSLSPLLLGLPVGLALAAPLSFSVLDAQSLPVQGAVLTFAGTGLAAVENPPAEMAQAGRAFVPPVLAVQTGTAVNFPNRDTVRHHVYSFSPAKKFELRLYQGTPSEPVIFDKPGLVVLGCNIHDWMLGYVYITDDPRFAVSDEQGQINLDLPPGTYQMTFWHPTNPDLLPQARGEITVPAAGLQQRISLDLVAPPLVPAKPASSAFGSEFEKAIREAQ